MVFEAFYGGYFGPSVFYYILEDKDCYIFKSSTSEYGEHIYIDDDNLLITKKTKKEYDKFINNLKLKTKYWKETYINNNIMDATQWNINFILENRFYSGSNKFPINMNSVLRFLIDFLNNKILG